MIPPHHSDNSNRFTVSGLHDHPSQCIQSFSLKVSPASGSPGVLFRLPFFAGAKPMFTRAAKGRLKEIEEDGFSGLSWSKGIVTSTRRRVISTEACPFVGTEDFLYSRRVPRRSRAANADVKTVATHSIGQPSRTDSLRMRSDIKHDGKSRLGWTLYIRAQAYGRFLVAVTEKLIEKKKRICSCFDQK